ncbi:MAG: DUF2281 domain-containing protein [Acidobacteria bacterium]|nr:DUF2281 domain-containing protein [Acidobacteriota bacterium]
MSAGGRSRTGVGGGRPVTRCILKTWERIAEKAKELPPEKQQEALDFVEYLAARASQAGPALKFETPSVPPPPSTDEESSTSWGAGRRGTGPDDDASASWGPERNSRVAGDDASTSWGPGRSFSLDEWRRPPPRRRVGTVVLAVLFTAVVVAVGTYLYLRFGRDSGSPGVGPSGRARTDSATAAGAAADAGPADAGPPLLVLAAPPDAAGGPAIEPATGPATPPVEALVTGESPDAEFVVAEGGGAAASMEPPDADLGTGEGSAAVAPDATVVAVTVPPPPDCGDPLGEAKTLWRSRDREGALQKLRDAIACAPAAVDAPLQWGRWILETPALSRDRDLCSGAADAMRPAAEANPNHGELWFHLTNVLFEAGRRDEALLARQHCQAIRPANDYVSSCRFLPQ